MTSKNFIADHVRDIPRSGIRDFFEIVQTMQDVISLGIGEPDFHTPWRIREAAIYSLERGHTGYTSNLGLPVHISGHSWAHRLACWSQHRCSPHGHGVLYTEHAKSPKKQYGWFAAQEGGGKRLMVSGEDENARPRELTGRWWFVKEREDSEREENEIDWWRKKIQEREKKF